MEEDYNPVRAIILVSVIILGTIVPIIIIKINLSRIKKGKSETQIDNASLKSFMGVVGFIFPIFHFINWGYSQNKDIQCKVCNFANVTFSNFCPNCKKDQSKIIPEYKCNYCLNTFTSFSKYCPKCGKDNHGKHKGGIS